MTLVAAAAPVPYAPFMPGMWSATSALGSDSAVTFNGAADKMAFVFQAASTTPPDQIKFRCSGFTSGGDIDVTIETVDATTGFPSGTPVTNTNTVTVTVSSTGTKTASGLSGTGSLTVGTQYAIVFTAAVGFAGNFQLLRSTGTNAGSGTPYSLTKDSAGAWTKASTGNTGYAIGFFDSGGTAIHMPGFSGAHTGVFQAFSDSTNPDERGNRFVLPFAATCWGALVFLSLGSAPADTNSFALSLYSDHTGTPSQDRTISIDGDIAAAQAGRIIMFSSPIDLAANTTYALAVKATSSGNVSLLKMSYAANAELGGLFSTSVYSTTRNNSSGAFTDGNTECYGIFPLLSQFHDGAGGGGGETFTGSQFNRGFN